MRQQRAWDAIYFPTEATKQNRSENPEIMRIGEIEELQLGSPNGVLEPESCILVMHNGEEPRKHALPCLQVGQLISVEHEIDQCGGRIFQALFLLSLRRAT